jgi:mRNA interferase RelE/StbE
MRLLDLTPRSRKYLTDLSAKQFRQLVTKIFGLLDDPLPSDARPLKGFPYQRADSGEYRIIYRFDDQNVRIVLIGKRNDAAVYKELQRLGKDAWTQREAPSKSSKKSPPGRVGLGVEKTVQVDDEIAHMRVVDGLLRRAPPGLVRCSVVRIDADDVEPIEIGELDPARILELAAEHKVQ